MATASVARAATDSGWSWVIAGACCWVTFVIQGLVRCGGVVYVSLIDTYGVTRGQASWPFTLRMAIWNLSGPIAGALSYRWSIRAITFTGILIVTAGNVICWFASDIAIVTVFLGGLQGFGVGVAVTLIPVIINQYFVKFKTTGAGIACAGATAGSFALPPIVEFTIEEFGLRGAFLMMGGITLHGILGAALMRPAEWLKSVSRGSLTKSSTNSKYLNGEQELEAKESLLLDARKLSPASGDKMITSTVSEMSALKTNTTDDGTGNDENSVNETSNLLKSSEVIPNCKPSIILRSDPIIYNGYVSEIISNSRVTDDCLELHMLHDHMMQEFPANKVKLQFTSEITTTYNPQINITPIRRQNTCERSNGFTDAETHPQNNENAESNRNPKETRHCYYLFPSKAANRTNSQSHHSVYSETTTHLKLRTKRMSSKLDTLLQPMKMSLSLITNTMFLLIAFNYSIFFLSYMTYLIVIVDYALDLHVPKTDSVFLVSVFSIADLCGRLGSGWITDSGFIKRRNLMMCNMLTIGLLLIATSFAETYTAIMAVCISMGLVVGINLILFYALLEEYLGLSKLAMAVGLMNFFIGCLSLVTPLLTGLFRDTLGSYDHLFHFLGSFSIIGGILWAIETATDACKKTTNEKEEQTYE